MCYVLVRERVTWLAAEAHCQRQSAHLTSIDSRQHLDWLHSTLLHSRRRHFWIGTSSYVRLDRRHRINKYLHREVEKKEPVFFYK